jgi:hypothetical protein
MTGAPALILHVGHSKTGSSALQSAFALSTDALARAGIHYPEGRETEAARAGRITSGNLDPDALLATYHRAVRAVPDARAVLLSNEACFAAYLNTPAPLRTTVEAGVALRILMFVRDPMDWAISGYMQMVKRAGHTGDFAAFLEKNRFLRRVEQFFALCDGLGIPVLTRNYSRCRDRLLPEAEALLDLQPGTLTPPPVGQVNRSMTRAELALLRAINREFGAAAGYAVADALCETLPDVMAEAPPLTREAFRAYIARSEPVRKRLNARLSADDAYLRERYRHHFDPTATAEDAAAMAITGEQAEVVVATLRAVTTRAPAADPAPDPIRPSPSPGTLKSGPVSGPGWLRRIASGLRR